MKPAIVLDAAMTSAAAARRLDADAPDALVAVRRHGARGSKWYVVAAGALLEVLRSLDERTPLAKALTKMKLTPASAMQWTEVELPVRAPNTVVLDGLEVVGAVPPGEEKSAGLRGMLTGAAVAVGLYVLRSAIKGAGPLTVGPEVISTSTEAGPSPTFEAATDLRTWPLIAGPDAIEPEARFDLTISLRGDEIAGVKPLRLTLGEQGRATLDVHLSAAGLSAPEGWHRRLVSMAGSELPSVTIPLQADAGTRGAVVIHITFLQNGIVCGNAVHTVNVGTESAAGRGIGSPLTFPTAADEAADVTVFLTKADAAVDSGRFVWKTTSPHVDVDATPHLLNLGKDAALFAKAVMAEVVSSDRTATLRYTMDGIARLIAEHVPPSFFAALRDVHAKLGRTPTLLLFSEECHVPWELAQFEPPLDEAKPPYLGAQTIAGRWVYSQTKFTAPAATLPVDDFVVLAGDYYANTKLLRPLPHAMKEAEYVVEKHGAIRMAALEKDVATLLGAKTKRGDGSPATVRIIHFACHGEVMPGTAQYAAIFLDNAKRLPPIAFLGSKIGAASSPLLFLNACQVATADEVLGDYAGFAAFATRGGCSAFIGPLWSVDDVLAHDLACNFYDRALASATGSGEPVGRILHDMRQSFRAADGEPLQSTWLAYVFYGHPNLRFERRVNDGG